MKLFPAGSTPWLLAHELRLSWRAVGKVNRGPIALAVIAAVLALAVGAPLAYALSSVTIPLSPPVVLGVDGAMLFLFTLMLSGTVTQATQVFFQRGDLDLLLSSPLPARRVLTARCVGMAVNAASLFLLLVSPMVLPTILFGHPEWLTVYPVLIALSLLATVTGLGLAMGLFALIGPRATRTLAQVLAALIGAGFYLASQSFRFFLRGHETALAAHFKALVETGVFAPGQPAAWPAQALLGQPLPALGLLAASVVLFLLVVSAIGSRFARNAAAAAGVGAAGRRRARGRVRGFTGGAFKAMLRKELRLLRRDAVLMSQVLLRVLYLLPLAFLLVRSASRHGEFGAAALAGGVAFMAGQVAGSLAWITMSAEEGMELLATAPAAARTLRRAKLVAAMIPVAMLLVLPIGALLWMSPRVGLVTAVGCLVSAVSACLISIWYERPAQRSDFMRRRRGSVVAAIAELVVGALWASATGMAAGPWWMFAIAPVILAGVALLALHRPQRSFAEVLQSK